MQLLHLFPEADRLQQLYGSKDLHPIYGAGRTINPEIMFIFMNPTARNVSSEKSWKGIRAPWLGTKNVWRMFHQLGILEEEIANKIQSYKPSDWTEEFSHKLYEFLAGKSIYLTNLAKCTQVDAKALPNSVFDAYRPSTLEEIYAVNPKKIITFGNQVSSRLIGKNISVSKYLDLKDVEQLQIKDRTFKVYPTYYPVGQGQRNIHLAKARIAQILE